MGRDDGVNMDANGNLLDAEKKVVGLEMLPRWMRGSDIHQVDNNGRVRPRDKNGNLL